jgi:hypothetical protein
MIDILERLRGPESFTLMEAEAADEIEKLRKLLGLVEVKPRIRRECWVNVTPDAMWVYEDKESADHHHGLGRIACVKITIDCEEGEGL